MAQSRYRDYVLGDLRRWRQAGRPGALLTLVEIDGSSPRPLGAQMAVAADGEAVGFITGGCAETALIHEAQSAIANAANRRVRFGAGSDYLDIQLPCGSGILVDIRVDLGDAELGLIDEARRARRPAGLDIGGFLRQYRPPVRLIAAGKGPILLSLARLGLEMEMELTVASPEDATLDGLAGLNLVRQSLHRPQDLDLDRLDPWTAAVLLFHDHEWEPPMLARLLPSPCFYVGALGSRATHRARLAALGMLGVAPEQAARIHAPVGLDIGSENPAEIALSIIAQIIAERHQSPAFTA